MLAASDPRVCSCPWMLVPVDAHGRYEGCPVEVTIDGASVPGVWEISGSGWRALRADPAGAVGRRLLYWQEGRGLRAQPMQCGWHEDPRRLQDMNGTRLTDLDPAARLAGEDLLALLFDDPPPSEHVLLGQTFASCAEEIRSARSIAALGNTTERLVEVGWWSDARPSPHGHGTNVNWEEHSGCEMLYRMRPDDGHQWSRVSRWCKTHQCFEHEILAAD